MIHPEPIRHRLHRLTPPIQQQTPQIRLTFHPLIRAHQRGEHIRSERLKPLPHNGKLVRSHPNIGLPQTAADGQRHANLTKHY